MKRLAVMTFGLTLAAVPALFGLTGNPALSQSVPVRIPVGVVRVPTGDVQNEDNVSVRQGSDATESTASPSSKGVSGHGTSGNRGPGGGSESARQGDDSPTSGHGLNRHGGGESSSSLPANSSESPFSHRGGRSVPKANSNSDDKVSGRVSGSSGSGKSGSSDGSGNSSGSGSSGGGG